MRNQFRHGTLFLYLEGRIDSSNVDSLETQLKEEGLIQNNVDIAFDAKDLTYISSAGLRVLLKVKKKVKRPVSIVNVSDEVFDILDVTGFTDIFEVERVMRQITLNGCRKLSSALNGEIFQLSDDEMIKVYGKDIPLSQIRKERSAAQSAMLYGVPTLIPYDVVKCEEGYGLIFEKAETTSLAYLISRDKGRLKLYATMLGTTLKELHRTEVPEDKFDDIKERYREWIKEIDDPADSKMAVFSNLISTIPDSNTYVHGDINLNSAMVQNGELLLLDMAGSARGHALFDLQSLFGSLVGIEKKNPGYCLKNYGLSGATCKEFWDIFFNVYMSDRQLEIGVMNNLLLKYYVLKESVLMKLEAKNRLNQQISR